MTVDIYDTATEQTVSFTFEPAAPVRGTADGQTLGCHCPRCRDPDDDRRCLHAGRDKKCYCPGCADPEQPGDSCWKRGSLTCGRCGRRDWASLNVAQDPPLCGRCCWEIYHDRQTDLAGWST